MQRVHPTTHTFTYTPIITSEGKLLDPLHVTLQEEKGKFGPRVEQTMFRHEKMFITCSKSGKYYSTIVRPFQMGYFQSLSYSMDFELVFEDPESHGLKYT